MSKKRQNLDKLIHLNQTWISRSHILHSIQSYKIINKKIKIILDCGEIIIVNNSKNSSSRRRLMNNKLKKICKKCNVQDYKVEIFKTKKYDLKNQDIKIKMNSIQGNTNKKHITKNIEQRIKYFLKTNDEKEKFENEYKYSSLKELENKLIKKRNDDLLDIYENYRINDLSNMERIISNFMIKKGFLEVKTPIIIDRKDIELMGINPDNDKNYKLFKVDDNKYLRPMLAPGLYVYLKKLGKILKKSIKIFEIGKCFRRESDTNNHLEEFTMLNFCCMDDNCNEKILLDLIKELLSFLNIEYSIINDNNQIYGKTIDIMYKDLELSSAVVGPVEIDVNWGINKKWIGAGFGIERLLKAKNNYISIKRSECSKNYYNGIYLN